MYPIQLFKKTDLILIGIGVIVIICSLLGLMASKELIAKIICLGMILSGLFSCFSQTIIRLLNRRTMPISYITKHGLAVLNNIGEECEKENMENWVEDIVKLYLRCIPSLTREKVLETLFETYVKFIPQWPIIQPNGQPCKAYAHPTRLIVCGIGDSKVERSIEIYNLMQHELSHIIAFGLEPMINSEQDYANFAKKNGIKW